MLGTKSLSNLPVAVIVSEVALPKSTSPPNEVIPATAKLLPKSVAPLTVVIPATARLPFAHAVTPVPTDNDEVIKAVSSTSNVSI